MAAGFLLLVAVAPARAEVEEVEAYGSLPELVQGADAVVLGQVVVADKGRSFGGCGYTAATLRVDQVLAGQIPPLSPVLTVEYFGWCGPTLPQIGREIPADRGVFFLSNKGVEIRQLNPTASEAEVAAEAAFWRLAILAGSAVDVGGRVRVPVSDNAPFLAAFEGQPFGALLDAVLAASPQPQPAPDNHEGWSVAPLIAVPATAAGLAALIVIVVVRRRRAAS